MRFSGRKPKPFLLCLCLLLTLCAVCSGCSFSSPASDGAEDETPVVQPTDTSSSEEDGTAQTSEEEQNGEDGDENGVPRSDGDTETDEGGGESDEGDGETEGNADEPEQPPTEEDEEQTILLSAGVYTLPLEDGACAFSFSALQSGVYFFWFSEPPERFLVSGEETALSEGRAAVTAEAGETVQLVLYAQGEETAFTFFFEGNGTEEAPLAVQAGEETVLTVEAETTTYLTVYGAPQTCSAQLVLFGSDLEYGFGDGSWYALNGRIELSLELVNGAASVCLRSDPSAQEDLFLAELFTAVL